VADLEFKRGEGFLHPLHLNSHIHFSLFTEQKEGGVLENFRTIEEPPRSAKLDFYALDLLF
jgi:hypothetical protein